MPKAEKKTWFAVEQNRLRPIVVTKETPEYLYIEYSYTDPNGTVHSRVDRSAKNSRYTRTYRTYEEARDAIVSAAASAVAAYKRLLERAEKEHEGALAMPEHYQEQEKP